MAHKFDHKEKHKLHTPERIAAMPPIETLANLGLSADDTFADIGCGTGYFTEAALSIMDRAQNIYALDTSREMLDSLLERLGEQGVTGLNTVQTDEYNFKIADSSVTYLLMSFVLHEVDDPSKFIREGMRILQKKGRIAIIEWEKKPTAKGPPVEHRLSREQVTTLMAGESISNIESTSLGTDFYTVIGNKE